MPCNIEEWLKPFIFHPDYVHPGYWGTEKYVVTHFQKMFPNSIKHARVGFMAPDKNVTLKNPTYRQVSQGDTGYVEVLFVEMNDPTPELFVELLRYFFMFHDPTTSNRQGHDVGTQYASHIFTADVQQKMIADRVVNELRQLLKTGKIRSYISTTVRTQVNGVNEFYEASIDHQRYLIRNPNGHCNHFLRFYNWPAITGVK